MVMSFESRGSIFGAFHNKRVVLDEAVQAYKILVDLIPLKVISLIAQEILMYFSFKFMLRVYLSFNGT